MPADYREPTLEGRLDLGTESIDLSTCFGVRHHIPNVSFVIGEIARVLKPGGLFLLREPISAMGDWNRPRPGLTRNERGLPMRWLMETLGKSGLIVERKNYCIFPGVGWLGSQITDPVYNSMAVTRIDALTSWLFSRNNTYYRDKFWKKFAPGSIALILRKV